MQAVSGMTKISPNYFSVIIAICFPLSPFDVERGIEGVRRIVYSYAEFPMEIEILELLINSVLQIVYTF
jgi:hypothetical protein